MGDLPVAPTEIGMRFSENGFYIEKYLKCANCGLLVYGAGVKAQLGGKSCLYCSDWCAEWAARRERADGLIRMQIVHPALPIEAAQKPRPKRNAPRDMVTRNILDSTM